MSPSNEIFDPVFLDKLPVGIIIIRRNQIKRNEIIFTNKKFQNDYRILVGEIDKNNLDLDFLLSFFDADDEAKLKEILISDN